jgi:hypothetical protein
MFARRPWLGKLAHLQAGGERGEVAERHLGEPAVRADHGDEVRIQAASPLHADEGEPQALPVDVLLAAELPPDRRQIEPLSSAGRVPPKVVMSGS